MYIYIYIYIYSWYYIFKGQIERKGEEVGWKGRGKARIMVNGIKKGEYLTLVGGGAKYIKKNNNDDFLRCLLKNMHEEVSFVWMSIEVTVNINKSFIAIYLIVHKFLYMKFPCHNWQSQLLDYFTTLFHRFALPNQSPTNDVYNQLAHLSRTQLNTYPTRHRSLYIQLQSFLVIKYKSVLWSPLHSFRDQPLPSSLTKLSPKAWLRETSPPPQPQPTLPNHLSQTLYMITVTNLIHSSRNMNHHQVTTEQPNTLTIYHSKTKLNIQQSASFLNSLMMLTLYFYGERSKLKGIGIKVEEEIITLLAVPPLEVWRKVVL